MDNPKIIIGGIIFVLMAIIGGCSIGCERIDAGHVGVQVDLYGSNKGVQDVEMATGMVWFNRWTTSVYEFPTFVQKVNWAKTQESDNSIHCTTSDGMNVSFDVGFHYSVQPDKVSHIFRKYRLPLEQVQEQFLRTSVRNAYNGVAGTMTAEHIISNRKAYEDTVRRVLMAQLQPDGFIVQQIAIVGKIAVPRILEDAINSKITAVQNAQRAENEKQQTIAEAQKKIEEAKGYSESLRIRAEAEANANRMKQQTLTPLLVQQEFVNKWDGRLPTYGTVPNLFKQIQESDASRSYGLTRGKSQ